MYFPPRYKGVGLSRWNGWLTPWFFSCFFWIAWEFIQCPIMSPLAWCCWLWSLLFLSLDGDGQDEHCCLCYYSRIAVHDEFAYSFGHELCCTAPETDMTLFILTRKTNRDTYTNWFFPPTISSFLSFHVFKTAACYFMNQRWASWECQYIKAEGKTNKTHYWYRIFRNKAAWNSK